MEREEDPEIYGYGSGRLYPTQNLWVREAPEFKEAYYLKKALDATTNTKEAMKLQKQWDKKLKQAWKTQDFMDANGNQKSYGD